MVSVSVVIPTYNRADSVLRAVQSALAQTVSDIEVIVIDDSSTDHTEDVITSIDDPRLRYLRHETNRGGSAARNTGIDRAIGEYIAFLDSDDEWLPTKLERQQRDLAARGPEWIGVYCDFYQTRSHWLVEFVDHRVRRPTGLEGDEELIERIFLRQFAHGGASTLFIEREAVEHIGGFDERFRRLQDLEFLVRLLQHGKLGFVDETLTLKHDSGSVDPATSMEARQRFNHKFIDLLAERGLEDRVMRIQQFNMSKHYFREGRIRTGMRTIRGSECPHVRDALGLWLAALSGIKRTVFAESADRPGVE